MIVSKLTAIGMTISKISLIRIAVSKECVTERTTSNIC